MSKIRIVAIIEAYTVTGPAKNLIRLCKLARHGDPALDISILTFIRGPHEQNAFTEAARGAGIRVDVIPEAFAYDVRVLSRLRRIIDEIRPDIVQTHGVKSHFLLRTSRLHGRYRWIAFHHGYTAVDWKMQAYNQLDRWSLRKASRIVTVCRPFVEELERIGAGSLRIDLVANAIEPRVAPLEQVEQWRARLGIRAGEKVLLSIGRLSREKGHIDLIGAAREVTRLCPDAPFRFVIAGEGPERPRLERAAAEFGGGFIFAGHVADVAPLYGLADMFVLPSHSEGSPNVLLEAMSAGLPIVATAVGGVPETVSNEESALLVGAGDTDALARAIARLLRDPELEAKLGASARKAAESRSPEAHREMLTAIYKKIASSPL